MGRPFCSHLCSFKGGRKQKDRPLVLKSNCSQIKLFSNQIVLKSKSELEVLQLMPRKGPDLLSSRAPKQLPLILREYIIFLEKRRGSGTDE